ncbi:bifunctional [glutamine synthetase] adenylyltransferase/[glutamine synthetase]-adenylyl-L-tyrosine phosphorylase [Sphingomonas sp. CGMCC 1.13654]|uniref:Bifunctional [glutamine synthetase] adenylyltransferase/[glutamine synthetase]-adenylyl-L-tyrosine phosphorylase n=1 Tax=Sphingomonas chungangi TaxID=2683589 RepID=A0A838L1S4_9SPHN|nr:bifunctional [glutamine synthetase] adenylyltransferase/[glutamine synthetase]-adenylyl-L-tyrosine phosphorylase [Sphingomonas chungangi]MBA2933443.1 bifunctional [glutamine synthetase] adenylyltransferase/[glutamine synthetase]-adenylyl-L-tyrosine phosphorylase [Sphingomonas chungangi]MVW54776.1 bifunctional [glutamine synthetase] adenylyltransferase/[glutamine synthetase]-adenylyl-L-tyrosine phosphorylase [Sphingomonas chungangi]
MSGENATRVQEALARALAHAPYLRRLAGRETDVRIALEQGNLPAALDSYENPGSDGDSLASQLRKKKRRLALALAVGDLSGVLTIEEVTGHLSRFADHALGLAIEAAIRERTPDVEPRGFVALALGKHGSSELNYSSDIDPILLFDPETLPRRARDEPVEAAARIARRVVELLQAVDGDGYVFRVDLRLRPSPEATPPALPISAALTYYESSALPWERAAFIRARAAAGDIALGQEFLSAIRPFVWRRSLDFGALGEIRALTRRIRSHYEGGQRFGPGYDLKRGRGGIREVEFFAQIHQLIHGGRDPSLRAPATLDALKALGRAGLVGAEEVTALSEAYRLYRSVEHRLQMVEDQQTHSLPRDAAALDNVAKLDGRTDGAALLDALRPHVERVGARYDSLDPPEDQGLPRDEAPLEAMLVSAGFVDAKVAAQRVAQWRGGGVRALRSPAAQQALEAVLPALVAALGRAPDPATALNRFDAMLSRLPSAINLFRLLEARPPLARLVGDVLSLAPALAEMLSRRAELIDGLIDASALEPPAGVAALACRFARRDDEDYQAMLDRVRREVNELRFAEGVQIVSAFADPLEVAAGYSRIAEGALLALADATVVEFERAHGRVAGGELLILALGRFGGAALTHASDLDLVYLFTGDHLAESDGPKPLGATHYFNRLAQRVTAALSVPTAAGPLYEVDTRLRPSGAQGLLAVSLDSFARYQREGAWAWEHMALARARPVYGSAEGRTALQATIEETLGREREIATLITDAVKMRGDMARHKPPAGPLDVKLIDGGLVDLEFAIHVTQLGNRTGFDPRLRVALSALIDAGLLPEALRPAYELLARILVTLRLISPDAQEPGPAARDALVRACGLPDWPSLLAALDEARQSVQQVWGAIVTQAGHAAGEA